MIVLLLFLLIAGVGEKTLWMKAHQWFELVTDKERIGLFIRSFGYMAPVALIGFQILQVIFAPFPGEITGFVGGYLFGALKGFICSTIGLSVGSWINFEIGRLLGRPFIIKHIPDDKRRRFEHLLSRDSYFFLFALFVFPGFPKDYLCLFLGLSSIPLKIFLLLSTIGRIPGTLLLSLQGAFLLEGKYMTFFMLAMICLVSTALAYRYRAVFFKWMEKYHNR